MAVTNPTSDNLANADSCDKVASADGRVEPIIVGERLVNMSVMRRMKRSRRHTTGTQPARSNNSLLDMAVAGVVRWWWWCWDDGWRGSFRSGRWNIFNNTHLSPLLSGLLVSLSQPVYSMVTVWPAVGWAPVPSAMIVLVTPIVKKTCACWLLLSCDLCMKMKDELMLKFPKELGNAGGIFK